jgi:thiol-disulfide isomerase/thioredoxin
MAGFRNKTIGVFLVCLLGLLPLLAVVGPVIGQAPQIQLATPDDEADDQFTLPETEDVDQLLSFIQRVQQYLQQNQPRSQAEAASFQQKLELMKTAAERIVQLEQDKSSEAYQSAQGLLLQMRLAEVLRAPEAEQRAFIDEVATRLQGQPDSQTYLGLAVTLARFLERIGKEDMAAEANKRFGEILAKQEDPQLSNIGKSLQATARRQEILNAPPAEQRAFIDELASRLENQPSDRSVAGEAQALAQALEQSGNNELAMLANRRFGEILARQDAPQLAQLGEAMQATARRMGLVGNEMELAGTTLEGKPFDWSDYRGKVVLVDFWATWCGPCLAELPNLLKQYELYHDRGFDVVGISLDQDREALEQFVEKNPLPWTTLHAEDGQHPAASYYGISAIPTVILVGKDGKVVSLNARGPELGQWLEKLLGPADAAAASDEAAG